MSETDAQDMIDALLDNPGTVVKNTPSMADDAFMDCDLNKISRELARRIYPPDVIARNNGLSVPQLLLLCEQPGFKQLYKAEKAAWDGGENAMTRAKVYHQEGMAYIASDLIGFILDPAIPAPVRLGFARLSAQIAGIDTPPARENPNTPTPGMQFAVNIHLGGRPAQTSTATVGEVQALETELAGDA